MMTGVSQRRVFVGISGLSRDQKGIVGSLPAILQGVLEAAILNGYKIHQEVRIS